MSWTINKADSEEGPRLDISGVARETGLSKDVLRVWERRYGFPKPGRDRGGERRYTAADVARLRAVKRIVDAGARPGKVVRCSIDELNALAGARIGRHREAAERTEACDIVKLLQSHDAPGLQHAFASLLMRQGLQRFVLDTMASLNVAVGEAWMRGALEIFEEHLYTELVQGALRSAINAFPRQTGTPRVLLTTLPGEPHGLGLLMVEALLVPEGAQCISLGVQTPLDGLAALRRELPQSVALWVGGAITRRLRASLPGVLMVRDLAGTIDALQGWRSRPAPEMRDEAAADPSRAAHVPSGTAATPATLAPPARNARSSEADDGGR
jgi:MerR family transcriptional regulator, light-induced transcriptional regulator